MAWRLAESLERLRDEVQQEAPGTTVWDIGDQSHQASASDHNPNGAGVVCAIDVVGDAGLDLAALAEQVRTGGHRAAKYVIYNRRIASRAHGWTWRHYSGSNPHSTHVHVSVGRGSDGQSTGPYDDTSPWGISSGGATSEEDDVIGLSVGDSGEGVKELQGMILDAGGSLPEYGVDGDYGEETAEALRLVRESVGSDAEEGWGDTVTGWAARQLKRAHAREQARQVLAEQGGSAEIPRDLDVRSLTAGEIHVGDA